MTELSSILKKIDYFKTKDFGLTKPTAIIFDWENTIISRRKVPKENFQHYEDFLPNFTERNIVTLLKLIKTLNIYCAIVSNKHNYVLHKEVNFFNLDQYFDKIIGAGDTPALKPSFEPIIYAIAESTAEFGKNIWMIGDSDIDITFAHVTLSTGILYNKTGVKYNQFAPKPDLVINNFEPLIEMLKEMFVTPIFD